MCGINDLKQLSLFNLNRNNYNVQEKYWHNWEYHASFSPLWSKRIIQHGGFIDHINEKVVFKEEPCDKLMQDFYSLYGYEPDEQKKETQEKSIIKIEHIYTWKWFNDKYKKNGLFDIYDKELQAFDDTGLIYE